MMSDFFERNKKILEEIGAEKVVGNGLDGPIVRFVGSTRENDRNGFSGTSPNIDFIIKEIGTKTHINPPNLVSAEISTQNRLKSTITLPNSIGSDISRKNLSSSHIIVDQAARRLNQTKMTLTKWIVAAWALTNAVLLLWYLL